MKKFIEKLKWIFKSSDMTFDMVLSLEKSVDDLSREVSYLSDKIDNLELIVSSKMNEFDELNGAAESLTKINERALQISNDLTDIYSKMSDKYVETIINQ